MYSYERKWNPRCVPNLHGEYQQLKPKVETNISFLVRHPFSDVHTVKTVGSHLKALNSSTAAGSLKILDFLLFLVSYQLFVLFVTHTLTARLPDIS